MAPQRHEQHFIERWRRVLYGHNKFDAIHFLQSKVLSVQKTCYAQKYDQHKERYDQHKDGYRS